MSYRIDRVVVVGAGTMGGGIAAAVANAGIPVHLLDVVPTELTAEEAARGLTLEDRPVRNRVVEALFERLKGSSPPPFPTPEAEGLVTLGNVEDDFDRVAEGDWIVEAVVEHLPPKRELMARIEQRRRPGSIVSSNTSGLPISSIAAETSDDFKAHFLGTHFFNPPWLMSLLEVIPARETKPEVLDFMTKFVTERLGKGVIVCKDTPNFVANRYASITGAIAFAYLLEHGYTIEEGDAVLGPLVGRPKTAFFRLYDLVGLDVATSVGANLYDLIPDDETREVLRDGRSAALFAEQRARNRLGNKTGQGFYKRPPRGQEGEILTLDLETMEYRPRREPEIPSLAEAAAIPDLGERLRFVLSRDDRAGALARHVLYNALAYAARRVPEIADEIVAVDRAARWGYAHELGPFEIWDALGVRETAGAMRAAGIAVAPWVDEMLAAGHERFYRTDDGRMSQYDPATRGYVPVED
jgi:3-hydroxyacyl-CoA dehydrogenase